MRKDESREVVLNPEEWTRTEGLWSLGPEELQDVPGPCLHTAQSLAHSRRTL